MRVPELVRGFYDELELTTGDGGGGEMWKEQLGVRLALRIVDQVKIIAMSYEILFVCNVESYKQNSDNLFCR